MQPKRRPGTHIRRDASGGITRLRKSQGLRVAVHRAGADAGGASGRQREGKRCGFGREGHSGQPGAPVRGRLFGYALWYPKSYVNELDPDGGNRYYMLYRQGRHVRVRRGTSHAHHPGCHIGSGTERAQHSCRVSAPRAEEIHHRRSGGSHERAPGPSSPGVRLRRLQQP